jgi:glutamate 5-kinase
MKTMQKIVIKVGTSTLTQGTENLSRRYMLGLVQQMAHLQNLGIEVILVSSGAVATGRGLLKTDLKPSKQTFASIGQVKLMQVWAELFALFDLQVGQVLLTKEDFSLNNRVFTKETLDSLLQHKIIPIINENDTVATKELGVGNNDNLAALVATVIGADTVILLTDQEGLYTSDPRHNPEAELISVVKEIDDRICAYAGGSSSSLGTGGMATKIQAAQMASRFGTNTIIASSIRPNILIDLVHGRQLGTLFLGDVK